MRLISDEQIGDAVELQVGRNRQANWLCGGDRRRHIVPLSKVVLTMDGWCDCGSRGRLRCFEQGHDAIVAHHATRAGWSRSGKGCFQVFAEGRRRAGRFTDRHRWGGE